MARIIYGAFVTSIRGSIGGTTFQNNAYGFTVKNKPNLTFPDSASQNNVKRAVTRCTQRWQTLGSTVQNDWDSYASSFPQYAKYNPSSRLSGYAVFLKRNMLSEITGGFALNDPSLISTINSTLAPTLTRSGSVLTIQLNPTPSPIGLDLNIFGSSPGPSNRPIRNNQLRFLAGYGWPDTHFDISGHFLSVWGIIPSTGDKVRMSFQNFGDLTGAVYAYQYFDIIVL